MVLVVVAKTYCETAARKKAMMIRQIKPILRTNGKALDAKTKGAKRHGIHGLFLVFSKNTVERCSTIIIIITN